MISTTFNHRILLTLSLVIGASTTTQAQAPEDVVFLEYEADAIVMIPLDDFDGMTLTIRESYGEGPKALRYEEGFSGQSTPTIELTHLGEPLPDGNYTWEISAAPIINPDLREQMLTARANDDFETLEQIQCSGALNFGNLKQSGSFTISDGHFADPYIEEPTDTGGGSSAQATSPFKRDQVFGDDIIGLRSLCIGFDCKSGESFGFDTIRVKENNLRFNFDDTSSTASFPRNDWTLLANDSANGGMSRFSIVDVTTGRYPMTIQAKAPNSSLFVDERGNLGLGTNSPAVELHIVDGDSPALRLHQDTTVGWQPQVWDLSGNETNFFVRNASRGTLPFRILESAPLDTMILSTNGHVGLGTAVPRAANHADRLLEIKDSGSAAVVVDTGDGQSDFGELMFEEDGDGRWSFGYTANDNRFYIYNYNRSDYDLVLSDENGFLGLGGNKTPSHPIHHKNGAHLTAGGVWQNASSRTLKEHIETISINDARRTVMALEPVSFNYIAEPKEPYLGFIAEDVPDMVSTGSRQSLSPMDITAVLTKVVQYQQKTVDAQALQLRQNELDVKRLTEDIEQLRSLVKKLQKR